MKNTTITKLALYLVIALMFSVSAFAAQTVFGVVSDAAGTKINNTDVSMYDSVPALVGSAVTNESGQYSIVINPEVPNGIYKLEFNNSGILDNQSIVLLAGMTKEVNKTLRMAVGKINGTVSDASGAIQNAVVTATANGMSWTVSTNIAGAYSFSNLPMGTYSVQATADTHNTMTSNGNVLNADGQVLTRDLTLTAYPTSGNISVATMNGSRVLGNATLELKNAVSGVVLAVANSDATGHYTFANVAMGDYVVTASMPRYNSTNANVKVTYTAPNPATVTIDLPSSTVTTPKKKTSGGGGGSAGGAAAFTNLVVINFSQSNPITLTSERFDTIEFVYNGVKHHIVFSDIRDNAVDLTVYSTKIAVDNLTIGSVAKVNLDEEPSDDLSISLNAILKEADSKGTIQYKVSMTLELLQTKKVTAPANVSTANATKANITEPSKPADEKKQEQKPEDKKESEPQKTSIKQKIINVLGELVPKDQTSKTIGIFISIAIVAFGLVAYLIVRRQPKL